MCFWFGSMNIFKNSVPVLALAIYCFALLMPSWECLDDSLVDWLMMMSVFWNLNLFLWFYESTSLFPWRALSFWISELMDVLHLLVWSYCGAEADSDTKMIWRYLRNSVFTWMIFTLSFLLSSQNCLFYCHFYFLSLNLNVSRNSSNVNINLI